MDIKEYSRRVYEELSNNILPFWTIQAIDKTNGGYWGKMTFDGHPLPGAPKSLVLNARILWTLSSICLYEKKDIFLPHAQYALDYITKHFIDDKYGGAFWMLNSKGQPLDTRKEIMGQAVLIQALVEYYKVTLDVNVLQLAEDIFELLETKCLDEKYGGYYDAYKRDWSSDVNTLLSDGLYNEKKTLHANIQLLEAYTSFCKVWKDGNLFYRLKELMDLFYKYILDSKNFHYNLLFNEKWRVLSNTFSYGYDFWASWLLCDAARVIGNKDVITEIEKIAVIIVNTCMKQALDHDNGVFASGNSSGPLDRDKHGWVQAEAAVGFLNAYTITHDRRYYEASVNSWLFIEKFIVDKVNEEWHCKITRDREPLMTFPKISIWKSPFFNGRACMEILRRLYYIRSMQMDKMYGE